MPERPLYNIPMRDKFASLFQTVARGESQVYVFLPTGPSTWHWLASIPQKLPHSAMFETVMM